jgi:flagellar motility protein MotE (MotC chaperone)
MAYAIMRASKLSGMGAVAASLQHCHRERETRNADPEQTEFNQHLVDQTSTDSAMGKLRDLLPEKRRKDAVLVVEYVMTASPDWWQSESPENQAEFFHRSMSWLSDKYGKENIITATIHRDELTPHLSAFVVPLTTDGRLSAKEFIGNRTKMSNDQTTFANSVKHLGLTRGIEGSRATHQRVKSHYGALQQSDRQNKRVRLSPDALEPEVKSKTFMTTTVESPAEVAERISDSINTDRHPLLEKAAVSDQKERRIKELQQTLTEKNKQIEKLKKPFTGLNRNQMERVEQITDQMKKENKQTNQRQRPSDRTR